MLLPFLKDKKLPRMSNPEMGEKSYNLSPEEKLDEQLIDELWEAAEDKNPQQFRSAIEALVLNMFEEPQNDG